MYLCSEAEIVLGTAIWQSKVLMLTKHSILRCAGKGVLTLDAYVDMLMHGNVQLFAGMMQLKTI